MMTRPMNTYTAGSINTQPAKWDSSGCPPNGQDSPLFPVKCCPHDLTRESIPWHWHQEMEAFLVTDGTAAITIGASKHLIQEGEGAVINAGILHAAWKASEKEEECRIHSIVFHPRLIGGNADSIFWQNYLFPLTNTQSPRYVLLDRSAPWHLDGLYAIESAWHSYMYPSEGYEFRIRSALSQLIIQLSGHLSQIPSESPKKKALRDEARIKLMLQYIYSAYAEEITTKKIAANASVSESECLRCFRSTIGMPPVQYVKWYRIQKAAELLLSTDWKIAKISAYCGFQDTSYFVKTFRELKGSTPGEYRKRYRDEQSPEAVFPR